MVSAAAVSLARHTLHKSGFHREGGPTEAVAVQLPRPGWSDHLSLSGTKLAAKQIYSVLLMAMKNRRARRVRWFVAAATVLGLGVLVAWANLPAPVAIDAVSFHSESESVLEAGVDSCSGELTVTKVESSQEVRLLVEDHRFRIRPFGLSDCQYSVQVELDNALGDRTLIDEATNRRLPVRPNS